MRRQYTSYMCGIVGVVGGPLDERRAALARAVAALTHRGPDGHGIDHHDLCDLGHTRLAILDRSERAAQPLHDTATGCTLVYNGEIYNYVELRQELEVRGHRFASTGDSEVLLRAYIEWGEEALPKLNGMFAFAVRDPRIGAVLLARDRFGEKPLYLCRNGDAVWFASEVKALLAARVFRPSADQDFVHRFLVTGDHGDPARTPFSGVSKVPPASWVRVDGRWPSTPRRYWTIPPAPRGQEQSVDWGKARAEELAELLGHAVAIRLRSDVPVGTSLSGGVDSSLVLALVRAARPDGELHAFTASFPGSGLDELPIARSTAEKLGVTIHPVELRVDDLTADIDAVHWAQECPFESPSIHAQYRVMHEAAAAGITVLLDGQGADESWAGYPKYARYALTDDLLSGRLHDAWRLESAWSRIHGERLVPSHSRYSILLGSARTRRAFSLAFANWPRWLAPTYRRRHGSLDLLSGVELPAARAGRVASDAQWLDLERVTLPRLLHFADRNSMRWSREVRLPYLDHRVVEFAMSLPIQSKLCGGWTKEPLRARSSRRTR